MEYRALYRKYRPATFAEVVGQEHITTTLQNQIAAGTSPHAYLFCGTRGTGKTSTAKIFARRRQLPLARAWRALRQVRGMPAVARSGQPGHRRDRRGQQQQRRRRARADRKGALRAAESEGARVHHRRGAHAHRKRLQRAAQNAGGAARAHPVHPRHGPSRRSSRPRSSPAASGSISTACRCATSPPRSGTCSRAPARPSTRRGCCSSPARPTGGMRDALSLADQCLAFCGNSVCARDVYDVLGSMEQGFLFDMAGALLGGDAARALHMLDGIVRGGRDLTVFCQDLAGHLRALLLAGTCGRCEELLDCTGRRDGPLSGAGQGRAARLAAARARNAAARAGRDALPALYVYLFAGERACAHLPAGG